MFVIATVFCMDSHQFTNLSETVGHKAPLYAWTQVGNKMNKLITQKLKLRCHVNIDISSSTTNQAFVILVDQVQIKST